MHLEMDSAVKSSRQRAIVIIDVDFGKDCSRAVTQDTCAPRDAAFEAASWQVRNGHFGSITVGHAKVSTLRHVDLDPQPIRSCYRK